MGGGGGGECQRIKVLRRVYPLGQLPTINVLYKLEIGTGVKVLLFQHFSLSRFIFHWHPLAFLLFPRGTFHYFHCHLFFKGETQVEIDNHYLMTSE